MICRVLCEKCGQPVPNGAKFCGNCGAPVQTEQGVRFCSTCGTPLESGVQFCPACGTKVSLETGSDPVTASASAGTLLATWKMASLYKGEPKVGVAKATGPLFIYDDRLEFKKTLGNSMGSAFGLIGLGISQLQANKDPLLIYPLSQIMQLRVGKYGGVYNTLVVVMRDGTTVSFCPAVPGSAAPQNVIDSLKPYMQKG